MTQNQHLQGTKGVATTQINAKVKHRKTRSIHSNKRVFAKLYAYVLVHIVRCHIYIYMCVSLSIALHIHMHMQYRLKEADGGARGLTRGLK